MYIPHLNIASHETFRKSKMPQTQYPNGYALAFKYKNGFLFDQKTEPNSLIFLEKFPLLSSKVLLAKNSPLLFCYIQGGAQVRLQLSVWKIVIQE